MTEHLQTRIRQTYDHIHLSTHTEDVVRRGTTLRRRRQMATYLAAVGVTAGAVTLAATVLPGGQPSAFASWQAHPTAVPAAQSAAAVAACRDQLSTAASLPAKVVEGRGTFTFTVLTDGTRAADCLLLDENGRWRQGGGSGPSQVTRRSAVNTGEKPLAVESAGSLTIEGDNHAADVWGWVGRQVTAVRIASGGGEIDATVSDGVFAAWWPTAADGVPSMTIVGYDRRGHKVGSAAVAP